MVQFRQSACGSTNLRWPVSLYGYCMATDASSTASKSVASRPSSPEGAASVRSSPYSSARKVEAKYSNACQCSAVVLASAKRNRSLIPSPGKHATDRLSSIPAWEDRRKGGPGGGPREERTNCASGRSAPGRRRRGLSPIASDRRPRRPPQTQHELPVIDQPASGVVGATDREHSPPLILPGADPRATGRFRHF